MLDRALWIKQTGAYRNALKLSTAAAALGTALVFGSSAAHAQQVVPGNSPECPIVVIDGEQVAICEGDLSDGVTASPGSPDYDEIIIRDTTVPIAPPGYFGVGLVADDRDLDIRIEEGVVINVFDDPNIGGVAQGIIAIAQNGFNINLETAADITADGNGSFALGIEAVSQDAGGEVLVINRGDVDAFTTGDSAIAVQARGDTFAAVSNPGGNLTAQSNGTGERSTVTAGILAVANNGTFRILNDLGDISVETGAGTFDTDFNGIAGALVGNAFNSRGGSSVSNTGNLTAVGPQTHGIVGFVQSIDASLPAQLNITTGSASADETSISTNGIGSFGILAQGAGENVIIDVLSNSAIDMTAVGGTSTGIFALNQAEEGSLTVTNRGTITGRGDTMRGLGATTFGAPVDGDYVFDITNEGDITLDTPNGFGITAFATRDDDVEAVINNSGNIDLSSTTNPGSIGISASFGNADPNADPMADGDSSVAITNSGDITMGAGVAIFAAADDVMLTNTGTITVTPDGSDAVLVGSTGSAQTVDLAFSGGDILSESTMPIVGGYAVRIADATEGSDYSVSLDDMTVLGSLGVVSFGDLQDNTDISLTATNLISRVAGDGTPAILVSQFGDQSVAEFSFDRVSIEDGGGAFNANIDLAEIGEGSALAFNISNSALFSGGGDDVASLMIGGLGGANSALNVNILNTGFGFSDGTSLEIAKFAQESSTAVLTIGGDSLFDTRRDDSSGIAVGTADLGPIDNFSTTISIKDSRVFAIGERTTGIFVDSKMNGVSNSDFGILISGVEINTGPLALDGDGESSHGIEIIGAQNVTLGDRDNFAAGGAFSTVVIDATKDIIAAGLNSDAIRITNQDQTAVRVAEGATVSSGTGAGVAINLLEASNNAGLLDAITDEATVTKARLADRAMNLITTYINSSGTQTTSAVGGGQAGADPFAVDAFDFTPFNQLMEIDNATVESVNGAGAIVSASPLALGTSNGAIVRTGSDGAAVISAGEAIALVGSDTSFSSMGNNAPLFSVTEVNAGDGTGFYADLTDIIAMTSGTGSDAIAMGGGVANSVGVLFLRATDLANPSVVSTTGDGSSAVSFDAPGASTFAGAISRSEISTTGAAAAAILLNMDSTSSTSLELLDTLVSTTGNGSDVVRLNVGGTSDYTFIVADSELTSEGDDSVLFRINGRDDTMVGTVVMIGGTLASQGDSSGGILIENDQATGQSANTFFFGESSITTEGDNAGGFVFERIAGSADGGGFSLGSFTLDAVAIATGGANSDAFFGGSLLSGSVITTNITNSSFATGGDNSRAYFAEALGGGNATSLVISSSDFSTEGANSTAVTFNEGSVFSDIGPAASSVSAFDIDGSTISTLGDNSRGIDVATLAGDRSTTVISMSENTVTTAGANSDAISIGTQAAIGRDGASHTVSMDFLTLETAGDDSRGIYFGSLVNGLIGVDAFNGGVTDATIFTADNVIATSGARSHGMEYATIAGDLEDGIVDIVAGNSTIQTRGDNAIGMLFGGVEGSFIDNDATAGRPQLSITWAPLSLGTEGTGSHGIQIGDLPAFDVADNASITLTLLTRSITTTGDGAHGIVIGSGWGDADSDTNFLDPGSNRFTSVSVDGAIDVSGAGSHGIVSDSLINDFSIAETGSITSADGFAMNFAEVDDGQTAVNLGEIDGDVIFGGGDDVFDSSGTFTGNIDMGAGANSIFIRTGGLFNSLDTILLGAGNAITIEGDLAPGEVGPFQTTAIGSDLFFESDSRFLIDIDGMTADMGAPGFFVSDRVTVDGNITIDDATLVISSLTAEGDFDRSAQFLILDAAGTLTGEFGTIDADLPFLDLSVTYEGSRAILNAGRQGPVVPFASLGLTPNQRAVGASFDALEMTATGDLDDVIEQLIFASIDQALTAFDTASGEIYASLLAQAGNDGLRRSRETLARARSAANSGWGIWGGLAVSDGSTDGDGNGAAVSQDDFGFDFGIDYVGEDNTWAAGLSTGWRDGNLDVPDRLSMAEYSTWYLAGHARYGSGGQGVTVTAGFDFAETDADVIRTLTVNALTRTVLGNADIDTFSLAGEARYGVAVSDDWAVGPIASVIHANSDLALDNETNAGSVALTSAQASDGQTRFGAGLFANFQSDKAVFDLSGQYVEASSNSVGARLAFADGGNAPFTVLAPVTDGSGVLTSASAQIDLGSGLTLGAQADALFGGDVEEVNGSVVLGWRF
ncbi:autotransporter outer membrane beta-barrel domain-containing protein [Pontixanthobacter sp. CEM42]|uniref:autotransporter outer membrane beta-barrel domain-containing protein n=1 Tax=Pontixanthobacter sp. CEM42 TaxID=2792077 RepID=UPI001ADFE0D4|nr:autotransporter outer membrane beta-barrel domain-containing protein [Pontixanthobacter sp. CEM42]